MRIHDIRWYFQAGSWTMRCACLLRVVGTRGAHRPRGDMWSPRAVHSRLVQREACASVLSAAATVAGPRLGLKNFYDRLDSLVMRTDSSCVEISDSRVFRFGLFSYCIFRERPHGREESGGGAVGSQRRRPGGPELHVVSLVPGGINAASKNPGSVPNSSFAYAPG